MDSSPCRTRICLHRPAPLDACRCTAASASGGGVAPFRPSLPEQFDGGNSMEAAVLAGSTVGSTAAVFPPSDGDGTKHEVSMPDGLPSAAGGGTELGVCLQGVEGNDGGPSIGSPGDPRAGRGGGGQVGRQEQVCLLARTLTESQLRTLELYCKPTMQVQSPAGPLPVRSGKPVSGTCAGGFSPVSMSMPFFLPCAVAENLPIASFFKGGTVSNASSIEPPASSLPCACPPHSCDWPDPPPREPPPGSTLSKPVNSSVLHRLFFIWVPPADHCFCKTESSCKRCKAHNEQHSIIRKFQ